MAFDDYLKTPGIPKIAVALERGGPMTFRQFTEASGFSDEFAAKVRDKMAHFGLISVAWQNKKTQLIDLTPHGKKYVALVHQQARIIEEAMRARGAEETPRGESPPR